tara:strand:+ start:231 stop:911 length:681 start_codon:yes stop_codon:yes gene_type:complete
MNLKKIIKKFFFVDFFVKKIESIIKKRKIYILSQIPIFQLEKKNISNLKIKLNRLEILKELKKGSICAELGVAYGEFSDQVLETVKPKLLVLVDSYPNKGNFVDEGNLKYIEKKYQKLVNEKKIQIINKDSIEAASMFKENFFDWIYIDTTHSYHQTLGELRAWKNKIKSDGYILGHDYIMGNWIDDIKYGVQEAVHQFCVEENWEIVYLTARIGENTSFGIKKIL